MHWPGRAGTNGTCALPNCAITLSPNRRKYNDGCCLARNLLELQARPPTWRHANRDYRRPGNPLPTEYSIDIMAHSGHRPWKTYRVWGRQLLVLRGEPSMGVLQRRPTTSASPYDAQGGRTRKREEEGLPKKELPKNLGAQTAKNKNALAIFG